MQLIPRLYIIC